jgi:hypothetical protein
MEFKGWMLTGAYWSSWKGMFTPDENNWNNFTPIHLEFESGKYKGHYYSMRAVFMNFGGEIELYHIATREEFGRKMDSLMADVL